MDAALELVGLPVACGYGSCKTKGFVKPHSDYGGWMRRGSLIRRKRWYCPKHAEKAREDFKAIQEKYATPEPEPTAHDTTEELYKLLD